MLVVLQHLIHQCYHLGNLVALVGSKLVLDPSGEGALFGIALLTLVNDFFVKDLHSLYDEADVGLLMLSFRGALRKGRKVTDYCIPLSHCIALLIQSRVVELQKQDIELGKLWDRLLS